MNSNDIYQSYLETIKNKNNINEAVSLVYKKYLDSTKIVPTKKAFSKFLNLLISTINSHNAIKPVYVTLFDNFLTLDADEATSYLITKNMSLVVLRINLENYLNFYRPDLYINNTKEYKNLLKIINNYANYLKENGKKEKTTPQAIYEKYLVEMQKEKDIKKVIANLSYQLNLNQEDFLKLLTGEIKKQEKGPLERVLRSFINYSIGTIYYERNLFLAFYKANITPENIKNNLSNYLVFYRPEVICNDEFKILIDLTIKEYQKYMERKNAKDDKKQQEIQKSIDIIKDFVNSEYSIERYCLGRHITYKNFMKIVDFFQKNAKESEYELYTLYLGHLKELYNDANYQEAVFHLLNLIKEKGDNFDFLDVFLETNYAPLELVAMAKNCLNPDDLKLFKNYVHTGKFYLTFLSDEITIRELVRAKYFFEENGELIEIPEEERNEVRNEMYQKCIPIDAKFFYEMCQKHYKELTKTEKNY